MHLQYLNKLYSNGLIDPNGFIQEEVDMIAKGTNDQIGVFPNYSYDDITVGDYAGDYTYLLPLKDSNGERHYQPSAWSGTVIVNQFAITNNCPYPEAMLRLYDYINSSFDNRLLFGWGPKDMAWVDNGDGTISKKQILSWKATTAMRRYVIPYLWVSRVFSFGRKKIMPNSRLLRTVKSSIWKDKSLTWTAP